MTLLQIKHEHISKCLFNPIIEETHGCQNQFKREFDVQRFIFPSDKIHLAHYKGIADIDR